MRRTAGMPIAKDKMPLCNLFHGNGDALTKDTTAWRYCCGRESISRGLADHLCGSIRNGVRLGTAAFLRQNDGNAAGR